MSSFDWELDKLTKKKKNQCINEAEGQLHKYITNGLRDKEGGKRGGKKQAKEKMTAYMCLATQWKW